MGDGKEGETPQRVLAEGATGVEVPRDLDAVACGWLGQRVDDKPRAPALEIGLPVFDADAGRLEIDRHGKLDRGLVALKKPDPRPIASQDPQLGLTLAQAQRLGVDRKLYALVGGFRRTAGQRAAGIVLLEQGLFPFLGHQDRAYLAQTRALIVDLEHEWPRLLAHDERARCLDDGWLVLAAHHGHGDATRQQG